MSILNAARLSGSLLSALWRMRDRRGSTLVETATVLPVALFFIFGVIDAGRLVWTRIALFQTVQDAARCASVNPAVCGSNSAVQTYAVGRMLGVTVPASTFTLVAPSTSHTCGYEVDASYAFTTVVPYVPFSMTIRATACFPQLS